MTINIYTLTLEKIIEWNEIKRRTIPTHKQVYGLEVTQKDYSTTTPREIEIIARMTQSEKEDLEDLQDLRKWYELTEDDTLIDYVWIRKISFEWKGREDYSRPWLTSINLLCSNV